MGSGNGKRDTQEITTNNYKGAGRTLPPNFFLSNASFSREKAYNEMTTNDIIHSTILLAEDEEETREIIKGILEDSDYTVIEAASGKEAIEKYNERQTAIDLLIFDVLMPEMTGKEAYEKIRASSPAIKIIFMSGSLDDIRSGEFNMNGAPFFSKPFKVGPFLSKVREVLGQ